MSNKKRRNRKAASESIGLELQSALTGQTGELPAIPENEPAGGKPEASISQTGAAGKTGLISYLRIHLWLVGIICFLTLGALGAGLKYLDEDAKREMARRANQKGSLNNEPDQSFLNRVNPFLSPPDPTPTPQLTRNYLYAGSRLLAVQDANANSAPPADLAIWRKTTGEWWVSGSADGVSHQVTQQWGANGDQTVQGDYDGDGKTDFAVWRPTDGNWYIVNSSSGTTGQFPFGLSGDLPAQADFDGDGRTDAAVFRPSTGIWYIRQSSNYQTLQATFGTSGDKPTPADYDGDGRADVAVWRNSETKFYSQNSSNLAYQFAVIGVSSTQPVPADYDGDGRANFAIKSGANWIIANSLNQVQSPIAWQQAGDIPVQNDYDGDGKVDIAVWRDSTGDWYIKNSSNGSTRTEHWGASGDTPVPANYRR